MERAFRITLGCAVVFAILIYVCYRTLLSVRGGDDLSRFRNWALATMVVLIVLFIISGTIALGLWVARLYSSKVDSMTIDLE